MADIQQTPGGGQVVDYMARDYTSLLQAMYDLVPSRLPEWQDFTNQADFGNVLLQLFAHIGDILSYYQDRVANESFLGTARTRRSIVQHLRLIGYELATAAPAAASLSLSVPASVNATVTINRGDAFATRSDRTRPSVRFEYRREAPLVIDFSTVPVDSTTGRRTFVAGVPIEEGRLIQAELVGTSDGSPNQRFALARPGVILRPAAALSGARDVVLTTQLGAVVDSWTLQDSLAFSRAAQTDFVVEVDENDRATVVFGDGTFGAVPAAGSQIHVTYAVGGGLAGNVAANAISTIVEAPQLALLGAQAVNLGPATGGAERETIDHAVRQAPAIFRSLKRAVTAADYEALALGFKGVGKVRAVPAGWNQVTLFVAPEGGGKVSDVLESDLRSYFEDKRMVGQVVEVADVDYVPIVVTAEIEVESFFVQADVVAAVQAASAALLAFDHVDFAQTIYLSKFYEDTQAVPGVRFVNITEFHRQDQDPAAPGVVPSGKIELGANEVPVVPSDPGHAPGMKVTVINQAGI
jgi:hypothetical protein